MLGLFWCAAGAFVRRSLLRLQSAEEFVLVALATPIGAALVVVWSLTALEWMRGGSPPTSVGQATLALVALGVGTLVAFPLATFYVLIPMGVLSTVVLRWLARRLWPEPSAQPR